MKRAVFALIASGLLAACDEIPTKATATDAKTSAAQPRTAVPLDPGKAKATPLQPAVPIPRPAATTVPRQPDPVLPPRLPGSPAQALVPGAKVQGDILSIQLPEGEPISYRNGVPVPYGNPAPSPTP